LDTISSPLDSSQTLLTSQARFSTPVIKRVAFTGQVIAEVPTADPYQTASVAKPPAMNPDFSGDDRKSSAASTPDFSIYSTLSMAHPSKDDMHLF